MAERPADPEVILRRFNRGNVQRPTYKALADLGKAVKTIFLYVTWDGTARSSVKWHPAWSMIMAACSS